MKKKKIFYLSHKMRILHLIAFDKKDKNEMIAVKATWKWYKRFQSKNLKTLYYYHSNQLSEEKQKEKMILSVLSHKPINLIDTLKTILSEYGQEFDVLVCSNVSSVINYPHLISSLNHQQASINSKTNPFYGGPLILNYEQKSEKNKEEEEEERQEDNNNNVQNRKIKQTNKSSSNAMQVQFEFVHGACIVLNAIAIKQLFENPKLHFSVAESTNSSTPNTNNTTNNNNIVPIDVQFGLLFFLQQQQQQQEPQQQQQQNFKPIQLGTQYIGFHKNYNLDVITVFHNKNNIVDDIQSILTQTHILLERYFFVAKKQQVKKVLYFGLDITQKVKEICFKSPTKNWITNQSNTILDEMFGDPMPNMLKTLSIHFLDPQANLFAQCANLEFSIITTPLQQQPQQQQQQQQQIIKEEVETQDFALYVM